MSRLAALFLLCATLASGLFAGEVKGPEGWPLQAVFPRAPLVEKHEVKGAQAVFLASCEVKGEQFRLLRVVPVKGTPAPDPDKVYEQAYKKYFSTKDKVLIDALNCTVLGQPARRYVYASHKGKRITDLFVIVFSGEVYELSHETGINDPVTPEATRFKQ